MVGSKNDRASGVGENIPPGVELSSLNVTQCLLFSDVFWPVNRRTLTVPHHRSLIDDLSTDSSDSSPSKKGGIISWIFESNVVKKGTTSDVYVGIRIGDLGVFRENSRGDFAKGSNDLEILIIGAHHFTQSKLNGGSWVLCS